MYIGKQNQLPIYFFEQIVVFTFNFTTTKLLITVHTKNITIDTINLTSQYCFMIDLQCLVMRGFSSKCAN